MKRVIKSMRVLISVLLLGSAFGFVSCSSDDENLPQIPDEVTTNVMFGKYAGKMTAYSVNPLDDEGSGGGEEVPAGVDISANVNNDTICFGSFPIRDIVLSIIKDETLADKIVEAVGDVTYKIGYKPSFTTDKDSIVFVLNPEPLKLSVTIPSATEEEAQSLQIEVKVEAGDSAAFAVESGNAKFGFSATEVLLGEGEGQIGLPGFRAMTFNFDMNKSDVKYYSF